MVNVYHQELLQLIKDHSGNPTKHTFLDSYLGNEHPRYPINTPALRSIAIQWMRDHRRLPATEFVAVITSLIEAPSSTEKVLAGIMMDYATPEQRMFNPGIFDRWLDHLIGWAEVDAVCTGKYTIHQLPLEWKKWSILLKQLSKSKNIHKRRASLVLLCSPVRHSPDKSLVVAALENVNRLKSENAILITKAVSWLLRSLVKYHKKTVADYVKANRDSLPSIATRETMTVLKTGKKTKSKKI